MPVILQREVLTRLTATALGTRDTRELKKKNKHNFIYSKLERPLPREQQHHCVLYRHPQAT